MTDNDDLIPDRVATAIAFPTEASWDNFKETVNNNRRFRLLGAYTTGTIIYNGTNSLAWTADIKILFMATDSDTYYVNTILQSGSPLTCADDNIIWARLINSTSNITLNASTIANFDRAGDLSNQSGDVFILGFTDTTVFHYLRGDNLGNHIATKNLGLGAFLITSDDADQTHQFGRTLLRSPFSDYAGFSHRDMSSNVQYAMFQTSAGLTQLNSASGQPLRFAIDNDVQWSVDASGHLVPVSTNTKNLGSISLEINNLYIGAGGIYWGTGQQLHLTYVSNFGQWTVENGSNRGTEIYIIKMDEWVDIGVGTPSTLNNYSFTQTATYWNIDNTSGSGIAMKGGIAIPERVNRCRIVVIVASVSSTPLTNFRYSLNAGAWTTAGTASLSTTRQEKDSSAVSVSEGDTIKWEWRNQATSSDIRMYGAFIELFQV
jgi:hypothetical protein